MAKRFISKHSSTIHMLIVSAAIAFAVFLGGHAVLEAAGLNPCDDECEFIDCEPPQGAGCGLCGQYVEWTDFVRAGDHCISCMSGWCKPLKKYTIDECIVCEESFVQQCQTCVTGI